MSGKGAAAHRGNGRIRALGNTARVKPVAPVEPVKSAAVPAVAGGKKAGVSPADAARYAKQFAAAMRRQIYGPAIKARAAEVRAGRKSLEVRAEAQAHAAAAAKAARPAGKPRKGPPVARGAPAAAEFRPPKT